MHEDKEEPDSSAIREAKHFIDENYMYDIGPDDARAAL